MMLPKVVAAAVRGDGALLDVVLNEFEAKGFCIIGAHEACPELACPNGAVGAVEPRAEHLQDIKIALAAAQSAGRQEAGQAAIAKDGHVIAIEDDAGTDALLERAAELDCKGGVLVKTPKPQQDRRVDLPTTGLKTVISAARAGLAGVALSAGQALLLRRDEMAAAADDAGVFLVGVPVAEDNA